MSVSIENLVTSGTFSLDGGTWDVDNNVWIVGNERECVIIDAPHDADAIINQVRGRKVLALLLTHAHNDHLGAARAVAEAVGAPAWLNTEDQVLWEQVFPGTTPILASIRERLLTLPPETVVRTGHGENTTIAAERETLAQVTQ